VIAERAGRKLVELLHRAMLRTASGPLRPLWAVVHRAAIRAAIAYLRHGEPGSAGYVAGSFGHGEPTYGLSDIDLVIAIPGDPRRHREHAGRIAGRWTRLGRRLPIAEELMFDLTVMEDRDMRNAMTYNPLTYGLDRDDGAEPHDTAAYFGAGTRTFVREYSGPHPPLANLRRIAGRDRRLASPRPDVQWRRLSAWLELQRWWRYAFRAAIHPSGPRTAHLCVKLVSEPARIWLWLAYGEETLARKPALERALELMPEEAPAIRWALELDSTLSGAPEPPMEEALGTLVRLSSRIADRLCADAGATAVTEVRLAGDPADVLVAAGARQALGRLTRDSQPALALADWRSIVVPRLPDEAFAVVAGDPADPSRLGELATAARPGTVPVLRSGPLHVMPAPPPDEARLRSLQCEPTDPVSFALARGARQARFFDLAGWSAIDVARRAVAEHRAWLRLPVPPVYGFLALEDAPASAIEAGRLLTAARAALFGESLADGDPELALTVAGVAAQMRNRGHPAAEIAEETYAVYRAWRLDGEPVPARTLRAMRDTVLRMPAYARSERAAGRSPSVGSGFTGCAPGNV
jgi:hypothetical protein